MKECLKQNKLLLFITIIFSIISSAALSFVAMFFKDLTDNAVNKDIDGFKQALIYSVIYFIFLGVSYFIYDILSKKFLRNIILLLRKRIFSGIFRRNYRDFTSENTADYISVLTNDIKLVEENYILPLLLSIQNTFMFLTTFALLLYLNPLVTGVLVLSALLIFIVPALLGKALQSKQKNLSDKFSFFTTKLKDMLSGYDVIRSFNLRKDFNKEFQSENKDLADTKFAADTLIVINETLSQLLGFGTQLVAIALSCYLVIKGSITAGSLLAIIQLSSTLVAPIVMILNSLPKISSMKPILEKIDTFINYKDTDFTGEATPSFNSNISLENLDFSYLGDENVLTSVNLTLEKGKKYALIGGSGSGKSTLIKLILGYYQGFKGDIKYDGENIHNLNINSLIKMTSIIHQNVYMFDKTIKENICLYDDFSNEELEVSMNLSGVNKFIGNIENGLDARLIENGSNISGGQRQRIAIARALIRKTPILVLDEGTSAIDMQTAYDIENSLLKIEPLTLITITHKMSSELLSKYDEIILMENGTIAEKGDFTTLFNNKGKFYSFFQLKS